MATFMSTTYSLSYKGKVIKLRENQVNAKTIGRVCNIFPDSIVLVSDEGFVEEQESEGFFPMYESGNCTCFTVHRESLDAPRVSSSMISPMAPQVPHGGTPSASSSLGKRKLGTNSYKPKLSLKGSKAAPPFKSESWRKNIEVCTIGCKGRDNRVMKKLLNHPVTLTAATACIEAVSNIISVEAFDGNTVVLLDKDNLRIPDNKTTRSGDYWRAGLLVKAVSEKDFRFLTANNELTISDDDDDDDDFQPISWKKHLTKVTKTTSGEGPSSASLPSTYSPEIASSSLEKRIATTLETLVVNSKKNQEDWKARKVIETLQINLKCLICKDVLSENCVSMTCCQTLGYCSVCFENWLKESETCPHCRRDVTEDTHLKMTSSIQLKAIIEAVKNYSTSNMGVIELV